MRAKTIADIKAVNQAAGQCWFSRESMKFFHSRIETALYRGEYFITSEGSPARRYSIRKAVDGGALIETVGGYGAYNSLEAARTALRAIIRNGGQ